MRAIRIEALANGYSAVDHFGAPNKTYVFTTLTDLKTWLDKNLDKPLEARVPTPLYSFQATTGGLGGIGQTTSAYFGSTPPPFNGILSQLTPRERGDECRLGLAGCDCAERGEGW
jgi:hypothetical protein